MLGDLELSRPLEARTHGGPEDEGGLEGQGRWEYNGSPAGGATLDRGSMRADGTAVPWARYPEEASSRLEQAYLGSQRFCDLGVVGGQYRLVDFGQWCDEAAVREHPFQKSAAQPWKERSVRRVPVAARTSQRGACDGCQSLL